ncbi:hypothetical protein CLF_103810 [Clonorchis sinensis]|uniref:Endonuclease/exonuclease/phosphatase domain-containing protein n=1 Tax=Clonorchis sinensis TaxID=79923 RepID=G7YAF7_CLOSI|nr:hypothetical protein CLF_103810 [Clonorchis sinensis]
MHSPTREKAIKNKTNSSLPNHTDQCKCSSLIDVLARKLELLSKALTDANTKNAAIYTKVDKELSSLNEYLALSTPGLLAAKKVIQLSDAAIKTATASLVDRRVRESRLIIWGSFSRKVTPTKQAQSLLGSVLSKPDHESLHASIDGYSVFRADSKRGRAGGVALYLHAALPIPIVLSDTTPAPFCDALWLQVPLRGSDSLLLGVVYRSPSSPPEDDHFLIRTLGQLSSSYHFTHLLLVGDFNAPKAPWTELQCVGSSGPFAAALTEVVQQSAWTQHVVAPTRYRAGQQPSLLDLVITNERHFVDQVTINAPLGHSDHCVLTFDFICYWARNPEPQTWIRNFCRADFSGMRIFLNQVKLGPASVEDLYRTIVQKVHEADAMYVPKKPARSRTSRKLPKRIRRLLEKRSQLFLKKLTTGDTEDELAFRKMRNRCKSEIRQWNIRKQATILDLARKNRNVLFKYMRHRRRNKPSAFSLRDRNGEPTSDPIVVSEFYRDHYAGDSANSFVMHGEKGPEDITRIDAKKDLGIWLSPNLSFSLHLEKLAQKAFAVLRMIRRTFSRITRTDFQILYGAYVRPLLEYANPVVYSGRTKDVILIERVQRAATKMVAGLKSMDYETRLVVLDLFPLEYRRLRGDLILTYALFEQGLANRFFSVDPANTRRGHGERQLLNDKNKTDPGILGKSLAPVYQSVNPLIRF